MLVVVAPLVGAWIEISESIDLTRSRYWSLPSWERGLKSESFGDVRDYSRRSPRGSVD